MLVVTWVATNGIESYTEQRTKEDVGPPRRVDCEISHWLEREMKHLL